MKGKNHGGPVCSANISRNLFLGYSSLSLVSKVFEISWQTNRRRSRVGDGSRCRRIVIDNFASNFARELSGVQVRRRKVRKQALVRCTAALQRWGYVTIEEVHLTLPLGSGVTYTTRTINSPRLLKRSGSGKEGSRVQRTQTGNGNRGNDVNARSAINVGKIQTKD